MATANTPSSRSGSDQNNFSHLYSYKLSNINAWAIQKWRTEKIKEGLAPSTLNRRVATLKSVLNKAVEWEVIAVNPLNRIKPLKIDKKSRVRYLSDIEEQSLRQALEDREHDIRRGRASGNAWREVRGYETGPVITAKFADHLKPMVLLTLNTGLRVSLASSLPCPLHNSPAFAKRHLPSREFKWCDCQERLATYPQ